MRHSRHRLDQTIRYQPAFGALVKRLLLGVVLLHPGPVLADQTAPVGEGWQCFASSDELEKARVQLGPVTLRGFTINTPGTFRSVWRMGFSDAQFPSLAHSVSLTYQAIASGQRIAVADVQLAAFDERDALLFIIDVRSRRLRPGEVMDAMQNTVVEPGLETRMRRICICPRASEDRGRR